MRFAVAMAGLLAVAALPARAQDAASLGWLSGNWHFEAPDRRWTAEWWTEPMGGMLMGGSVTGIGGQADFFEHARIAADADGTLTYFAMPRGQAAVPFRLVRADKGEAMFENAANDFPQRIHYRREGDTLVATISTLDGARVERWHYRRR
ncbi:hypothetical protein G432_04950 [Sphingomonas sp. MM-1]|uniref:DUF6265 family protein n=1 Tax=Sphingomonas sp. MM-1 TaxID=745310 RepID=UPI0002C05A82|nr:DUF6265 family protein [Sphingomonas sp. MM-1]AGH48717.1 hypothetical protein G432_04950 [Sphingomonas sp. MM-1]